MRGEFEVHNPSTGVWNQRPLLAHSILFSLAVFWAYAPGVAFLKRDTGELRILNWGQNNGSL